LSLGRILWLNSLPFLFYDTVSIACIPELVIYFDIFFHFALESNEVGSGSITIGGGLPDFLGVPYSGSVFSASSVSLSMSVVLRGAKKLQVNIAFGGSLTAVDVGTALIEFLAACEVLLDICLLRLYISWKSSSSSWAADYTEVLFTASLCPAYALIKDGLQFIQCYRVHTAKNAIKRVPVWNFANVCCFRTRYSQ
jgi:hypothetical protein